MLIIKTKEKFVVDIGSCNYYNLVKKFKHSSLSFLDDVEEAAFSFQ